MRSALEFLAHSDEQLAKTDPLLMNLLVASGVPQLSTLDIPAYQQLADQWASTFRLWLPSVESIFHRSPENWKNDIRFFRLAAMHRFVENELGMAYKEDHRNLKEVWYTDPSDVFLNGIMDSRRGTCGNMSMVYVALGWRLGWPVSLASVKSHFILRYDDGEVTHNLETTQAGYGGCKSDPDEYLIRELRLPPMSIVTGSDLRAFRPRELLRVFFGLRARHFRDAGRLDEAEKDYLLSRYLCPVNHELYIKGMGVFLLRSAQMFGPDDEGCPTYFADFINTYFRRPVMQTRQQTTNGSTNDVVGIIY